MGRSEGAEGISRGIAAVATPNATLLAGGPRRTGSTRGGALPRRQRHKVSRKDFTEEQRNERRWDIGVMNGSMYFLPLVVRGCREGLSGLRWAGKAVVRVGSRFRR